MNAIQLHKPDGSPVMVWMCGMCGMIYAEKTAYTSEMCCKCQDCGKGTYDPKGARSHLCDKCWGPHYAKIDADRLERAEEIVGYDGPVVYAGDKYYSSVDDMVDSNDDESLPEFVHTCHVQQYALDIDAILQNLIENANLEDDDTSHRDFAGWKELCAAVEAFNEANKDKVYWEEDSAHKVRVPERDAGVS